MLAKAPPDAPWRAPVQAALARVGGSSAPALSDDAVAAAKEMSGTDRDAMIHGMVERLAARLKQNGDDIDGWLRLVRAYMVIGDRDKARGALAEARQAVANDAERLRQLNDGLKDLGSTDEHDAEKREPDFGSSCAKKMPRVTASIHTRRGTRRLRRGRLELHRAMGRLYECD